MSSNELPQPIFATAEYNVIVDPDQYGDLGGVLGMCAIWLLDFAQNGRRVVKKLTKVDIVEWERADLRLREADPP